MNTPVTPTLGPVEILEITDTDFRYSTYVEMHNMDNDTKRTVLMYPRLPITHLQEVRDQIAVRSSK